MLKYCPHRTTTIDKNKAVESITDCTICLVASRLAMLNSTPTVEQCEVCTNHPTLPQRINGVTCAIAKRAQLEAGLFIDEKLTRCIHTEQTLAPDILFFLQNKWIQLHSYKLSSWDSTKAEEFFRLWLEDIPKFGCMSCASHFEKIIEKHPPNFSSHLSYFEWTVFVHNEVNRTLFKEELPLEKVKELYGIL